MAVKMTIPLRETASPVSKSWPAPAGGEPPEDNHAWAFDRFARNVLGASQLLGVIAESATATGPLSPGLELLSESLRQSAEEAERLIDGAKIDLSVNLGITTTELAAMSFAPVSPPFHPSRDSMAAFIECARVEFALWQEVATILADDDHSLEGRFDENVDEHLALVEQLETQRERWLDDMKLIEATLLRLAVVLARWELRAKG